MNKYVIDEDDLAALLRKQYKLNCLEKGGVNNWDNYSEALNEGNYSDYDELPDEEIVDKCDYVFSYDYTN